MIFFLLLAFRESERIIIPIPFLDLFMLDFLRFFSSCLISTR